VISFPLNSVIGEPIAKFNGEDGFPHSEICGSKVAHTSPQLIAACHVLHRLCMPRHPRIALTSRLRIHTTNDRTGTRGRRRAGRRIKRPSQLPEGNHSTQLDKDFRSRHAPPPTPGQARPRTRSPCRQRHRFLEPIHNVKEGAEAPSPRLESREDLVFMPGNASRWWSQSGSNRRPQACKASALPTELWPRSPT
jgi:hypothetical protein